MFALVAPFASIILTYRWSKSLTQANEIASAARSPVEFARDALKKIDKLSGDAKNLNGRILSVRDFVAEVLTKLPLIKGNWDEELRLLLKKGSRPDEAISDYGGVGNLEIPTR